MQLRFWISKIHITRVAWHLIQSMADPFGIAWSFQRALALTRGLDKLNYSLGSTSHYPLASIRGICQRGVYLMPPPLPLPLPLPVPLPPQVVIRRVSKLQVATAVWPLFYFLGQLQRTPKNFQFAAPTTAAAAAAALTKNIYIYMFVFVYPIRSETHWKHSKVMNSFSEVWSEINRCLLAATSAEEDWKLKTKKK